MYNVFYDTPTGVRKYCAFNMNKQKAESVLRDFISRYIAPDNSPRRFPNGKGYYKISNPRVERVA